MNSIGIFTTEKNFHLLMQVDKTMRKYANITYLPYSSPEHLLFLYEQNVSLFDGILFSGSFPYHVIKQHFGEPSIPYRYISVYDRDYYKLIARIAVNHPEIDFSRVYFESSPEIEIDFDAIFPPEKMPQTGNAPINFRGLTAQDWYYPLKEYYLKLWKSGEIDLLITRLSSMHDFLQENGIRHEFISASPQTMLEAFMKLLVSVNRQHNNDVTSRKAAERSSFEDVSPGITPLYIEKIRRSIQSTGIEEYTSQTISELLGISTRTAIRLLNRMSEHGLASCVGKQRLNPRGRPITIFKINL
ncbi:hypothetical protein [Clostridium vitabionis]|uniref:hypothetical protein n=1 Tax=Clostridium vitabionis TaxID=2784388 RepID=UPI00188D1AF2|nr:hypothetical protein [Clostridium vitabionis]